MTLQILTNKRAGLRSRRYPQWFPERKTNPNSPFSTAQESTKQFIALRRRHSAVESDIAAQEHHGLNRCLDVGLETYRRCVGYGVLAFNLHQIGRRLLARKRVAVSLAASIDWSAARIFRDAHPSSITMANRSPRVLTRNCRKSKWSMTAS